MGAAALLHFLSGVGLVVALLDGPGRRVHLLRDYLDRHALVQLPGNRAAANRVWAQRGRALTGLSEGDVLERLQVLPVRTRRVDAGKGRYLHPGSNRVLRRPPLFAREERPETVLVEHVMAGASTSWWSNPTPRRPATTCTLRATLSRRHDGRRRRGSRPQSRGEREPARRPPGSARSAP